MPKDPGGNTSIGIGQNNQDGYDLYSFGPDGKLGEDDDITNWSEERCAMTWELESPHCLCVEGVRISMRMTTGQRGERRP
jgi:hypothetical protein